MAGFRWLVGIGLIGLKRDKVLWCLFAVALLLLVLIPVISLLSMRQVQELALSLSLSSISLFLLVVTIFFGSTAIWRDVEKRYAVSVLTLPVSRRCFVLARFSSLAIFLFFALLVLGLLSGLGIVLAAQQYPADRPVVWVNFVAALGLTGVKYLLLLSITLFFSAMSSSFFLPVFGTLGAYFAGSASFDVLQFVLQNSERYSSSFTTLIKFLHYLLPNLSAFDFQVYAIYALPLPWLEACLAALYGVAYTGTVLFVASLLFQRREF